MPATTMTTDERAAVLATLTREQEIAVEEEIAERASTLQQQLADGREAVQSLLETLG
jgi:hypothetical protein